ncbi:MAG: 16S rRNA (cytidine(1402)-2'-O)-methyltransferase [Acidimicrobiales bacterium]|nr:16S rRNA (cytidine(1402)-2'-O)-methyltransferase [Acidimicrobiales bacterium]
MATLYLVSTPIGNLGDISQRAIETLKNVHYIACEDTRRSSHLFNHFDISLKEKTVTSLFGENERSKIPKVLEWLDGGSDVALLSDAGTPLISDPGEKLVEKVLEGSHNVISIPGPTALISALVISGIDASQFFFEGFLPRKASDRKKRMEFLASLPYTSILYEAPHRILKTLEELGLICGEDRKIAVTRELTKVHEEVFRGTIGEAIKLIEIPKGEYVLILEKFSAERASLPEASELKEIYLKLVKDLDPKEAVEVLSKEYGATRRQIYSIVRVK